MDMRNILEGARAAAGTGAEGAEEFVLLELERGGKVGTMGRDEVVDVIGMLGALKVQRTTLADLLVGRLYKGVRLGKRDEGQYR